MRSSLLLDTIKACFAISRTLCVEGPPGGGKTSLFKQAAKELDCHLITQHLPTRRVEDFGLPKYVGEHHHEFTCPDWFPAKGSKWDDGRGGILLFDDRNQADADLQKVLANVCQERELNGWYLADKWMVASTGNRQTDRAGSNRVLSHLRNRESVVEFETDLKDSTRWMIDNEVKSEVIAFMQFRPGLLHDFDPQRDANPTPRSWVEGVSDIIGIVPHEAEYEMFKGAVGEGAAAEFTGFLRIYRSLPNPDAILLNPTTADVPSDAATLYALSGALAERLTPSNMERGVTYSKRMPPEFSVLMVSQAVRRDPALTSSKAFIDWSLAHQDVLF